MQGLEKAKLAALGGVVPFGFAQGGLRGAREIVTRLECAGTGHPIHYRNV